MATFGVPRQHTLRKTQPYSLQSTLPPYCSAKPLWHKYRHVEALWRYLGAVFLEQNEEHGERELRRCHQAHDTANGRPQDILDQQANHLEHRLALSLFERDRALQNELLCWLIIQGRTADVRWLLEQGGADPEARDSDGDSALILAAAHGEEATLRLLVGARADPEQRNREGATPLAQAAVPPLSYIRITPRAHTHTRSIQSRPAFVTTWAA